MPVIDAARMTTSRFWNVRKLGVVKPPMMISRMIAAATIRHVAQTL